MEFRQFTNPQSGLQSSRYGNAYYHAKKICVELKWGRHYKIVVPDNVSLTPEQQDQVREEFDISM